MHLIRKVQQRSGSNCPHWNDKFFSLCDTHQFKAVVLKAIESNICTCKYLYQAYECTLHVCVCTKCTYLLFIRCKYDCKGDLHSRCHLATSCSLTRHVEVWRLFTSHFDVPRHLVQVPQLKGKLICLVRFKLLKDDLRGKGLKQCLVNVDARFLSKGGSANVQKLDDFWWVHFLS